MIVKQVRIYFTPAKHKLACLWSANMSIKQ